MQEEILKIIGNTLDSLDKLTIWIFTSCLVVFFSFFSKGEEITFGSISINKKYAGTLLYLLLCGLVFDTFQLLSNLHNAYAQLTVGSARDSEYVKRARIIIQDSTWIFNPFKQSCNKYSIITDNIGYVMLFVIWWMGNTLAFVTLTIKKRVLLALSILFFCLYLFLGLLSMFQIYQLSELIGNNQIKYNAAWIGFLTGLSFFVIASIIIKRQQRNKKPAQPVLSGKASGGTA